MSEAKVQSLFVPIAIIVAGGLVAASIFFSGGITINGTGGNGGGNAQAPTIRKITTSRDHVRGNPNAKVVIVEYSDLQCPFCRVFHETMQQVIAKYNPNDVAWVYRHFPLDSLHPQARPAALASECVAKMKGNDAFWRFADGIFADQANIGQPLYEKLAQAEGISAQELATCVADPKIAARVLEDDKEISGQGAQGTPFSVVLQKGKGIGVIPGALPIEQVTAAIDNALK